MCMQMLYSVVVFIVRYCKGHLFHQHVTYTKLLHQKGLLLQNFHCGLCVSTKQLLVPVVSSSLSALDVSISVTNLL